MPVRIDDAFIGEWGPRYAENDEKQYNDLVRKVSEETALLGAMSRDTFAQIYGWKTRNRSARHLRLDRYDEEYLPALQKAFRADSNKKTGCLVVLHGVSDATASVILHFMHPNLMPIMDVRTVEVLQHFGSLLPFRRTEGSAERYEHFCNAIDDIKRRCPCWTLREIDRALFVYHKSRQHLASNN